MQGLFWHHQGVDWVRLPRGTTTFPAYCKGHRGSKSSCALVREYPCSPDRIAEALVIYSRDEQTYEERADGQPVPEKYQGPIPRPERVETPRQNTPPPAPVPGGSRDPVDAAWSLLPSRILHAVREGWFKNHIRPCFLASRDLVKEACPGVVLRDDADISLALSHHGADAFIDDHTLCFHVISGRMKRSLQLPVEDVRLQPFISQSHAILSTDVEDLRAGDEVVVYTEAEDGIWTIKPYPQKGRQGRKERRAREDQMLCIGL